MIFAEWCDNQRVDVARKKLWKLTERANGRAAVAAKMPHLIRSHYDDMGRIAQDVLDLGFPAAAALLAERLPRQIRARSGELGEILATEFVEEEIGYTIPVRRLRYKDGREMALRGDDLLGFRTDENGLLHLLKGESKSRAQLSRITIDEARTALCRDNGRPTATSLLFMADRMMERDDGLATIGRTLRNEVVAHAIPASRIDHLMFVMSGNAAPQALTENLHAADEHHPQTIVHLWIEDHQDFIRHMYEGALVLGNN
ncbi:Hachiman antiphage defense system protein HamA [Glaciimonas soli]|uniref:DUF1837 domain-containing protein n=1 Tax=Glaciimonas soli TaxID=2590999 RepID=A0A843YRP6_9BURK|nr:Hachiman antiphage defense system protein HamA [Glaciimonas soli]MQR00667.1 DUF1837 domain-containing protein [Glaciimonas soli]